MNKLMRKMPSISGAVGALVATAIGIFVPLGSALAVGADTIISVHVESQNFWAMFVPPTPADGTTVVNPAGNGRVSYHEADSILVTMTTPSGGSETLYDDPLGSASGDIDFPYLFSDGYGDYVFTVNGENASGVQEDGQEITIHYHSAAFEITDETDKNGDPIVEVEFGPEVCGVSFQLYLLPEAPGDKGVLDPPYAVLGGDFKALSGYDKGVVKITLPLSQDPYFLPAGNYRVTMNTYSCAGGVIEEELGTRDGGMLEYLGGGEISRPPDTGQVRIGSLSIARSDIAISVGFVLVFGSAIFFYYRARRNRIRL